MGIFDFVKKQFIDVIEWVDQPDGVLMWRFPFADQEIQYGASLTVRDGQMAVFVNEGQIADVFGPGRHTLTTQTLPLLTNLKNWDKLFQSPFKSDVMFFSTRLQLGRKWGTPQPITLRDTDFGMVRIRAFGMYSYKLSDPALFYKEITGANDSYTVDQLEQQLRNLVVSTMTASIGSSGLPFLDMAANQSVFSDKMKDAMLPVFARYGLTLDAFAVENVSLPEELQKAIDTRISMGMMGDMNTFTQYQTAQSIPLAAQNEGGLAGLGAGVAAGVGFGQVMAGAMGMTPGMAPQPVVAATPSAAAPAPVAAVTAAPAVDEDAMRLEKLKGLLDKGLISQADYDAAKADILKKLVG